MKDKKDTQGVFAFYAEVNTKLAEAKKVVATVINSVEKKGKQHETK